MAIVDITDSNEKQTIARKVLEALTDWFGVKESREEYISGCANWTFFAAKAEEEAVGFLCLKETGKATVELAVMGVLMDYHRSGIGKQLVERAKETASLQGYEFMQVKTVKMGMYEDYDRTNLFYINCGFKEFEVFPLLWDEANPCQIYVMSLKSSISVKRAKEVGKMGTIRDYRNMVEQPWGKMFYELIYEQLNISEEKRIRILDFGAGFCITANYYAKNHEVVAVEPNEEMYNLRAEDNEYTLITQGVDYLKAVPDNYFDVVLCHNVLEYVENREAVLDQLVRVVKPEGILSIVKHNLLGRVMGSAVLADDPNVALELLNNISEDSMFGNRSVYSNELLIETLSHDMKLFDSYGIRTFFGLSSNNEIKHTNEWYQSMLALEIKTSTMEEFKKIAFFNHLIFKKETNKQ